MRKSFKYFLIIWAFAFVLFLTFVFVVPSSIEGKTIIQLVSLVSMEDAHIMSLLGMGEVTFSKYAGAFWPGFVFIIVSFLVNLYSGFIAFKEENNQKFFYNIPLIRISYAGLIINLIAGIVCMFFPYCPLWLGVAICGIVTVFTVISIIKAVAVADIVSEKDEKIKVSTNTMKMLTALAEANYRNEKDSSRKEELKKVYEALRYSDPVSNEDTAELEEKIKSSLDDCEKVLALINKRNLIAKATKQ